MTYKMFLMELFFVTFAAFSQQISISGIVMDSSGSTPIEGTVVKLEKNGIADTTDANGNFILSGLETSIALNSNKILTNILTASVNNNILSLYVAERGIVTITMYTIQGKMIFHLKKMLDAGENNIPQPCIGNGVYIYKIQAGTRELFLKRSPFGSKFEESVTLNSAQQVTANDRSRNTLRDVIFASKDGLLDYRVMITNSDTSGILIKMLANNGNVTDVEGNVYQSVKIGDQVWTVENFRSTKYNDGTDIPYSQDKSTWPYPTPGYCYYDNVTNEDTIKKCGILYNWYVVDPANPKQIAPVGWHVPDSTDWAILENYLIVNGYNWDGTTEDDKIAKSLAAKTDWANHISNGTIGCNLSINNSSGFSAFPSGYRFYEGSFVYQDTCSAMWSTTSVGAGAYSTMLRHYNVHQEMLVCTKTCGLSIRLIKD